ncbi:MAG: S24/S26 family peptidase [Lachnospiraceae bacterium]|nr:S24/S26 family peptidase [Lachnospiraceae bacterium]
MENRSSFEQEINQTGYLIYTNKGDSMMPLLRENRDLIHIRKTEGRCKKYDVPLYKRDSGQYVLHRILKVREKDYVLCGDNRRHREYGIEDRHIIGVLEGVTRDGKYIPVTDRKYRIYVHLWCDLFYLRAAVLFVRDKWYGLKRLCHR